mmetsp:Transcript_11371/g.8978  ORF Transcript_11371/g.8978 Transcript_11371/m.8978 type:complete len:111 (-) Transcript_11371:107-439(-)
MGDEGGDRTVTIEGERYTAEQIASGEIAISEGTFIVGCKEDKKTELLEVVAKELEWVPDMPYSETMPMFAGKMDQDKILWFLSREEVDFVEADSIVTVAKNEVKAAGAGE